MVSVKKLTILELMCSICALSLMEDFLNVPDVFLGRFADHEIIEEVVMGEF